MPTIGALTAPAGSGSAGSRGAQRGAAATARGGGRRRVARATRMR